MCIRDRRYGYASPTAFNRAFQAVHGIAPSEAKNEGAVLKAYPPVRFHLALTGGAALEYRIERHGAFSIIGISADIGSEMEQNFQHAPALWARACPQGGRMLKILLHLAADICADAYNGKGTVSFYAIFQRRAARQGEMETNRRVRLQHSALVFGFAGRYAVHGLKSAVKCRGRGVAIAPVSYTHLLFCKAFPWAAAPA